MKNTVMAMAILLLALIALVGCSSETTSTANVAVPISEMPQIIHLENANDHDRTAIHYAPDGESRSRLVIYSDGQFALVADDYVSFILSGIHTTENDRLFLGTDDAHIFRIEDDRLIFESGTWLENWIEQGTGFYLTND